MKHIQQHTSILPHSFKCFSTIIVLVAFLLPTSVWSTHIVGGSISYKCLGNDQYEVRLTVRRDCILGADDAPFDDPASVGIFGIDGSLLTQFGNNGELLLNFQDDETLNNEINQVCYSDKSSICVHITEYVGTITLPQNNRGYTLSYQRCCRNSSLNNVADPLNTGMTLFIELSPEALAVCNNSPRFDLRPDIFICAGEQLNFSGSATDEEGDLIVYSLCTPIAGATRDAPKPQPPSSPPYDEIEWVQGFGLDNLIGGDPIQINTADGMLQGTPGLVGQYIVGLCIEEFRNGTLLSRTHREFQYNVVNCDENQVVADFNVQQDECGLENIRFENESSEDSSYEWFFDYPSSDPAFISNEANPTFTYPAPGRYSIRLIATNVNTNCQAIIDKDITISDGTESDFSTSILSCTANDELNIRLSDETGLDAMERSWEVIINGRLITGSSRSIEFTAPKTAQISATLSVSGATGCLISQSQTVDVNIDNQIDYSYQIENCDQGFVNMTFTDESKFSNDLIPEVYEWTFIRPTGSQISERGQQISVQLFENEMIQVIETILFSNGCLAVNQRTLNLDLDEIANFETDLESCTPGERNMARVTFRPLQTSLPINGNITSNDWMVVNGETEYNSSDDEITLDLDFTSPVWVGHTVTFSNGCTANEERKIKLNELFGTDVSINTIVDNCDGDEISVRFCNEAAQIDDNTAIILQKGWIITDADGHTWRGTNSCIEYTGTIGEQIEVYYIFNGNNGCAFEQSKTVILGADDEALDFTEQIVSCQGDQVSISLTDNRNSERTDWVIRVNGAVTNRSGNEITILANRNDEVFVRMETNSDGSCLVENGKQIIINPDDLLTYSIDQINCPLGGIELQFVDTSPSIGGATKESVNWVFQTSAGETFNASGNSTLQLFPANEIVTVMLDVQYSNGCQATLVEDLDLNFANYLDYNVDLVSCNAPNQFSITINSDTDALPPSTPVTGIFWLINNGSSVTNESGNSVALNIDFNQPVEINLSVSYGNRCTFTLTRLLTVDDIIGDDINDETDVEIRLTPISCQGQDVTVSINNLSDIVLNGDARIIRKIWEVTGEGVNLNFEGNAQNLTAPEGTELNIRLTIELDNGCIFTINETRTVTPFDEEAIDFIQEIRSCNGDDVNLTLIDNRDDVEFTNWIIIINDVATNRTGRVISLTVNKNDEVFARFDTNTLSGCENVKGAEVITDPGDLLTYSINQIECPLGQVQLQFADTSPLIGGATKQTVNWRFQTPDGQIFEADGNSTVQTFTANQTIGVTLEIQYSNGCLATFTEDLDLNFANFLDYDVELLSCTAVNQFALTITANTDALPPINPVAGIFWLITNGSQITNESGSSVTLNVDMNQDVNIELSVSYGNRCTYTLTRMLSVDDILGDGIENDNDVNVKLSPTSCEGDVINVSLHNNSSVVLNGEATIVRKIWHVNGPNISLSGEGNEIQFSAENATEIEVSLRLELSNGCVFIINETKTVSPFDEDAINFTSDILSCNGDEINLVLADNNTSATNTEWIITINGQSQARVGRVINLTVNRDDEVMARINTGNIVGCENIAGIDVIVNPDDLLAYELELVECNSTQTTIRFNDISPSLGGASKEQISWVFQSSDGTTVSADGNTTVQSFPSNDVITVMQSITYNNACNATSTEQLDLNFGNNLDFDARLLSCNGPNQFSIELTPNINDLPITNPITDYNWTINNGGNPISETGTLVSLDVDMNQDMNITLEILYDNGCRFSFTDLLSHDDIFGDGIEKEDDVVININPQVCSDEEITYTFNNRTTLVLDNAARVIRKTWKITAPGTDNVVTDNEVEQINTCENNNQVSVLGQTVLAEPGTSICVPFNAFNFTNVGSIQTAFTWDPTVLEYTSFNQAALNNIDVNPNFTSSGELRLVWLVDFTRTQVTEPDNTTLFELCFDVIGGNGEETDITFQGIRNLAIEVTSGDLDIIDACLQAATVRVETNMSNGQSMNMITAEGDEVSFTGNVGDDINVMLTLELDNGCILILNEDFTVENIDIEFFNDFPELTMMSGGDNSGDGNNGGNNGEGGNDGDGDNGNGNDGGGNDVEGNDGEGNGFGSDAIIVVCDGQARPLIQNPNPNWTYDWSPLDGLIFSGDGQSNPSALPNQTTTYTVTVTEGECVSTGSITVIPVDQYQFTIVDGGTDACNGEVNLTIAQAPGATVEWSLDASFETILFTGPNLNTTQSNDSQIYFVRQIFESGCVSPTQSYTIESLSLDINDVMIDPVTNDSSLAVCDAGLVTISATTNANPENIQWIDLGNNQILGSGPAVEVDPSQVRNIRAAIDGGRGCIVNSDAIQLAPYDVTDDISLEDSNIPEIFCVGADTQIRLAINTDDELLFLWMPDPCIVSGANTAAPVINANDNKDLVVEVTNNTNGCVDQLTIPIRVSTDEMSFDITGNSDICEDDVNLNASPIDGAVVQWSLTENFDQVIAEGNQLITTQDEINQSYFARQVLPGGCFTTTESYDVSKNDIEVEGLNVETNTLAFCDGAETSVVGITNAGEENIIWFDASTDEQIGLGSPLNVDPETTPIIYGTVEGASGCTSRSDDIMLIPFDINTLIDLNLGETGGIPNGVCVGESTQINITNLTNLDLIYEWAPAEGIESGGNTASPVLNITEDTEFTLRVTNLETDCAVEVNIPIAAADPMVELFADPSSRIYLGSDADILAQTAADNPTYMWSTGETTPTITVEPLETTTYTVTITDENGCQVIEMITIEVVTDCSSSGVFLPNAFSPNGDGNNDVLFIRTNSLEDVSLVIFDRWGRQVFETTSLDVGWNGQWQNNGDELPPDAYGYYLTAICFTGEEYTEKGNVSILR